MPSFPLSSSRCLQNLHVLFLSSPEDICDDPDKDVPVSTERDPVRDILVEVDVAVDLSVEVAAEVEVLTEAVFRVTGVLA